jgi:ribosome-associated protein
MASIDLELRGEFIELDKLLKATGLADSGGRARALIAAGEVRVDGQVELRKTAKMRAGQVVEFGGQQVRVTRGQGGG